MVYPRNPGVGVIDHQKPFIPIARITRTQGRVGAVRIQIEFEEFRLFEPGRKVILTLDDRKRKATIEEFRHQNGRWVLKLEGLDSISEAEEWIGGRILVATDTLPPKAANAFYSFDLQDCGVYSDDVLIGTVRAILSYSGTELLSLDNDGEEILIPFVKAFLKKVDTEAKRIEVELPEGLIELNRKKK